MIRSRRGKAGTAAAAAQSLQAKLDEAEAAGGIGVLEIDLIMAHGCSFGEGGCATSATTSAVVAAEPFLAPSLR